MPYTEIISLLAEFSHVPQNWPIDNNKKLMLYVELIKVSKNDSESHIRREVEHSVQFSMKDMKAYTRKWYECSFTPLLFLSCRINS